MCGGRVICVDSMRDLIAYYERRGLTPVSTESEEGLHRYVVPIAHMATAICGDDVK
jgi:hypothetical protein